MLEYLLLGALGGAGLLLDFLQRRRLQVLRKAAGACGLEVVDTSGWNPQLTARAGPLEVRLEACGSLGQFARIAVQIPGPPDFSRLIIRREPLFSQEIETGDTAFDHTFFLEGPVLLMLALLDAKTRHLLIRVNAECRFELCSGALRAESLSPRQIPRVLPLLLDIGQFLDPAIDVPWRLADNATRDPKAGVRLRNLLLLSRQLSAAPETARALRAACSDPSPEIRLRAARALGAEGRNLLLKLAEGLEDDIVSAEAVKALGRELPRERAQAILDRATTWRRLQTARVCQEALDHWEEARRLADKARQDPEPGVRLRHLLLLVRKFPGEPGTLETLRTACSDPSLQIRLRAALTLGAEGHDVLADLAESLEEDGISAEAVASLGRDLAFERTCALLTQTLRRRCLQTARACLEALGKSGNAAAVDVLAKVMALEMAELAPAAALALGATGSPAAEPLLLRALQRDRMDVQVAACHALARIGTVATVLPLQEAFDRSPDNPELRRAIRQAIAEIQARLQGAAPGQLSLAGVEAGQLSLAQAEAGQLSLAADPAGQLSLPPGDPE